MRHSNPHKFPAARRIKNIEPVANCYSQWFQQMGIRHSRKCKTWMIQATFEFKDKYGPRLSE